MLEKPSGFPGELPDYVPNNILGKTFTNKSARYESIKSSVAMILGPSIEFDLDMNTAYYIHGLDEPFKAIAILQEAYNVLLNQNKEPDRQNALLALIHQRAQEAEGYKQAKNQPVYYDKLVDENDYSYDDYKKDIKKATQASKMIDVEKLKLEKSILDKEVQIKEYKKKVQAIDEYKTLPKAKTSYKAFMMQPLAANTLEPLANLGSPSKPSEQGAFTWPGISQLAAQMSKQLAGTIDNLIANTEIKTELQNAIMQYSNYTNISDYELGVTKVTANPLPVSPAPEPKRIVYVEEKIGRKFREE
jgi:hypothetical protein